MNIKYDSETEGVPALACLNKHMDQLSLFALEKGSKHTECLITRRAIPNHYLLAHFGYAVHDNPYDVVELIFDLKVRNT